MERWFRVRVEEKGALKGPREYMSQIEMIVMKSQGVVKECRTSQQLMETWQEWKRRKGNRTATSKVHVKATPTCLQIAAVDFA